MTGKKTLRNLYKFLELLKIRSPQSGFPMTEQKAKNSRELLPFTLAFLITMIVIGYYAAMVYAASEDQTLGSSATVHAFVENSMNVSSIPFGTLDPATQNNPSLSNPANLTNTANSNTAVDIYMNATNLTSGSNRIAFLNLSIATGNTPTASTPLNESGYINGSSANQGYIENLSRNSSINLFWFLDVEPGQAGGTYNGSLVIRAVANDEAP